SALECQEQRGDDLGERMGSAFADVFSAGAEKAVLVGSDIPGLGLNELNDAFDLLESHDAVIGPASDGGYYLIGFRADTLTFAVFRDMEWGDGTVAAVTGARLVAAGLTVARTRILSDMDRPSDVLEFLRREDSEGRSGWLREYLKDCIERKSGEYRGPSREEKR
ncbi:glycosyltransferase, partial [bacterium]|nr:glycosyltransferase [candidate division CSSED10-310 bacterium]